jgi:hypothetical protein
MQPSYAPNKTVEVAKQAERVKDIILEHIKSNHRK